MRITLPQVTNNLCHLTGIRPVMQNFGSHHIQSVLQHNGIVGNDTVHLNRPFSGQRPERKTRITTSRYIIDSNALHIVQPHAYGCKSRRISHPYLKTWGLPLYHQRLNLMRTRNGKNLPFAIGYFQLDRAILPGNKYEPRQCPTIGMFYFRSSSVLSRSTLQRYEILLLQSHDFPIDFFGFQYTMHFPTFARLYDRPTKSGKIGMHRHVSHTTPTIPGLQQTSHVLREYIGLDKRIAQKCQTHGTSQ